jgi:acyl-CoA synthetase (AMP-forming)/AMP-acid ligase II
VSLARLAAHNAKHYGDKPAYVFGDRTVTFVDFNSRVNRLVDGLRHSGVVRGARIAFLSRNSLAGLEIYGACEKGGYLAAPLNFRLTSAELVPILQNLDPHVVFVQSHYFDIAEELRTHLSGALMVATDGYPSHGWASMEDLVGAGRDVEPDQAADPDEIAYLMSTSGTTGTPRAAMLTHRGQWMDAAALALEMRLSPTDRHLATMPIYHVGGRAIVLAHNLRGCTVFLHDGFDAEAVARDVERRKITTTQVVPTMMAWLLDDRLTQRDMSSLRLIWYASAPMPVDLLTRAIQRFGPIFIQGYGQTECGPLATSLLPHEHILDGPGSEHLASAGRAVPGVEVAVVDEDGGELSGGRIGEIKIKSPWNMAGYWRRPDLSKQVLRDGWLLTGDMARVDARGYIYIVDRKKDMIISGGENIYPREVEEILYAHPSVLEATVIGVPDDVWGESVRALVVTRGGVRPDERELIDFCRARLAHYKCPKEVEFRDDLPKTASGKILKRALREPYLPVEPRIGEPR